MEEEKEDIIYSEPVRDILGAPPSRLVRWGNSAFFVVLMIIVLFLWLIRYPDRIPAPVEITTKNPPVTLKSKISGRIKNLYVSDKEQIDSGKIIAVMETAASIDDILLLKKITDTLSHPGLISPSSFPLLDELGEIQVYWAKYLKSLSDYNNYVINDFYGNKIRSLSEEIDAIVVYIGKIMAKERLYSENQSIETRKYKRDSLLYSTGVYSESELEKSYQSLLRLNIELQQVRLDHSAKSIELAEKRQTLQDYRINRIEEKEKYYSVLSEAMLNLRAQLKIWENTYTLVSPVSGTVTFTRYWSANQAVDKDEPVVTVVPFNTGEYIGRINLNMNRSGKVMIGQVVNIKLSGFPFLEYGMVKGIIRSKSLVPSGNAYIIELELPSGLNTLYGKKLDFTQNMQGTAEIITDNTRLLQKILNPFRYLISRNRAMATS